MTKHSSKHSINKTIKSKQNVNDMDKTTIQTLLTKKAARRKISMLAVSDYPFAKLAEEAKIDSILVGDSIGMTVFGYSSLLPVTMEIMIPHATAVRKGAPNAFLIGDLPFLTYEVTTEDAIRNAGRFMAECGCDAVKLEGGRNRADVIKSLVNASIPVVGHIGFTPQAMTMLGGFAAAGQDANAALRIVEDAKILEDAGICMLVLEAVPADVSAIIANRAKVPVIGFGSGPDLDGQILLLHDMIGMFESFTAKFAKRYVDMSGQIIKAVGEFIREVESGAFPAPANYSKMPSGESEKMKQALIHA
jgi:3-methyl-2-oxobutanoate hydroxymethyltransferase